MYTDIKTFEDACQKVGVNPADLPGVENIPDRHKDAITAIYKLFIITEAINNDEPGVEEFKPDFNNTNQYKWWPWFKGGAADGSGSGFRFGGSDFSWAVTNAGGGARLCFKDEERSDYAGEQFLDLYKSVNLFLKYNSK